MTGGGDGKRARFSAKSLTRKVADMMIRRKGFAPSVPPFHICSRSLITRLRTPIKMSVFMLRSCASSMMITEYFESKKSVESSRRSTPSVMNLIVVEGDTVASYRI